MPGGRGVAFPGTGNRPGGNLGQQHGVAEPMGHMEQGANRAAHPMDQRNRGVGEGDAALGGGKHHGLAGGTVIRLGTGDADVAPHGSHGSQGHGVGERVRPAAHVSFQGVAQGVDTGIRGQPRHRLPGG